MSQSIKMARVNGWVIHAKPTDKTLFINGAFAVVDKVVIVQQFKP